MVTGIIQYLHVCSVGSSCQWRNGGTAWGSRPSRTLFIVDTRDEPKSPPPAAPEGAAGSPSTAPEFSIAHFFMGRFLSDRSEKIRGNLQSVVKTTLQLPRFRPNQQGCNAVGIYTDFALLAPNHTYTQSALINNYYVLLSYVSSSRHLYVHFGIKSYTQLALMNKLAPLTFRSSVENFVDYSTTTQFQSASTVLVGLSNEHRHLLVASSAMKPVESLRSSCSPQRPSVHVVVDDQRGKVVCYPSWTYFVFPFAFFFFLERGGGLPPCLQQERTMRV